ncbi:nitric oxide reductase activation protein NorD [Pontibaca methylaminivorans]|uniref:Nitric oxide reductase NorD protein n=1 Tax=Pontibaca methylaminivorans TaxID=515897 RepID=A0A1R3WMJ2_9RHOB|nr:nitric oxide reductase D protein [Pontibaca methylaminivorans]SIT78666.1 nitric oxide reductase NorD protein [Pontibaca methylaminivorans]
MGRIEFEPWEPEETVGKLWHEFASRLGAPQAHEGASVDLSEIAGRLAVFFRGLGGAHAVEIRGTGGETSHHRLSWRRRLVADAETLPRASFDGEVLRLPQKLAVFPTREANGALYLWLTAAAAHAPAEDPAILAERDPLRADLAMLRRAQAMVAATLESAPGLAGLYETLCAALLHFRRTARLSGQEALVERLVRHALGDPAPLSAAAEGLARADLAALVAPRDYRPFLPVPLWPDLRALTFSAPDAVESRDTEGPPEESGAEDARMVRARRRKADQADRRDSLILHVFEGMLSWAEFLNLNRRIEDDEDDSARKAVDDHDEIGLGQISKAPATRLKLHLDLAPEDVDRERLAGVSTYPEWDARAGSYLPDHVRVLSTMVEPGEDIPSFREDPAALRRIRQVRRQFEALRPGRVIVPACLDGEELDMEALVRAQVDIRANGSASNRIWRQSQPQARDLAVSILLDISRSTESAVTGRAVIDIEREALAALAWGLDACGDDFAIHAFSSLKRDRVYIQTCKDYGEPMTSLVEDRIGALRPGFYTRLGAAIRHASAGLAQQGKKRRLLLVITDGKPNDLDHYEGRHGIEDTAMAVREARRMGHAVFGVTIDRHSKSWFPRLFGRGAFQVIPHPDKLTVALPQIYRELVGA